MFNVLSLLGQLLAPIRRSRVSRDAEILFLRQQLLVLRRSAPARIRLRNTDRLILVWLYRLFPSLLDAAIIFKPETLVRWHRGGFRLFWRWKSRRRAGRPAVPTGIRSLVRQMSRENPLWGAPRIHGELLKLRITSLHRPWLSIWSAGPELRHKDGRPSYAIMHRTSVPSICLSCRPLASSFCTGS